MDCGSEMTLIGNTVSGSGGPCISFNSFCIPKSRYFNNSGHSCKNGFAVKGSVTKPMYDMTLWQIRHVGIWGYSNSNSPLVLNCRLADISTGYYWGNIGGNIAEGLA